MNTNIRSIAARLVLVTGLAGSAMAIIPGVASAGDIIACAGKTITATASNTTLYGTCGNDTFRLMQFSNVTVYAGNGHDTIHAGFAPIGGTNYVYGEGGNDHVRQLNDARVWFSGGAGNDTLEGSSGYDAFLGGSGTDTFIDAMPGDYYDGSVELFG
jgi:Ca2+-binding RTX toxin-like protein